VAYVALTLRIAGRERWAVVPIDRPTLPAGHISHQQRGARGRSIKLARVHVLAISGSLRAVSSNSTLLRAAARLAPTGLQIELFEGLGELPHYNPDLEDAPPTSVIQFRRRIGATDGVIIASPEYVGGVPGSLKNALDWLVGGGDEFVDKPCALFNASPASVRADASLKIILPTMAGRIVDSACIAVGLRGKNLDVDAVIADGERARTIREALAALVDAIDTPPTKA
jgi:chromate reductase, NAD(P)H dehydrogenase (quinone)